RRGHRRGRPQRSDARARTETGLRQRSGPAHPPAARARRATAVSGCIIRRDLVHLPPAVCRRPRGDPGRAGTRASAIRWNGGSRFLRATEPLLAGELASLYASAHAVRGLFAGGTRVVEGGT